VSLSTAAPSIPEMMQGMEALGHQPMRLPDEIQTQRQSI
jgi:hypothetical protein